jgi:RNase P subunit RPR2
MGKKEEIGRIASERILVLYGQAKMTDDDELSRTYISMLREIAKHCRKHIPTHIKNSFCKDCGRMFSRTESSVRLSSSIGYVSVKCGHCGKERHIFYKH